MQQTQQAPRSTEKVCVSELPYMSKLIRFGHNMVLLYTIARLAFIKTLFYKFNLI